jgi:hypothetical protein
MNIAVEILVWQVPFSFLVALWAVSGFMGTCSPLVMFAAFLFAWLVVSLIVITFDLLVVLLGFTVTGMARRLVY